MKLYLLAIFVVQILAGNKQDWKSRTIYQVVTDRFARSDDSTTPCSDLSHYCGGSFKGIQNHLDYIKNLGFDAIWISPVTENMAGSYHGYHPTNFSNINSNFGTAQDLKELVDACHSKGIWVMLDLVANHVAPIGTDYSKISPFNSPDHYHPTCFIKEDDFCGGNVYNCEHCRLYDLPDLNQENAYVKTQLNNWVQNIVKEYQFDGIRLDAAAHVGKIFWPDFAAASGVFSIGEVACQSLIFDMDYQNYLDSILNFNIFFALKNVFINKQSMYLISNTRSFQLNNFKDSSSLGLFIDNHDNPRFLNLTDNIVSYKSTLIYVLFGEGIPIVYYGTEQLFDGGKDPLNREPLWGHFSEESEMFQFIKKLNGLRQTNQVFSYPHIDRYTDDDVYAWSRGQVLIALTNNESQSLKKIFSYHPYKDGDVVCNMLLDNDCVTVTNRELEVEFSGGNSKIYVPKAVKVEHFL